MTPLERFDHRVVIACEDGLLGRVGPRPFVEIGLFVGQEPLAVLFLHQAHRELVEPVALARPLRGEHPRAGDVVALGGRAVGEGVAHPVPRLGRHGCGEAQVADGRPLSIVITGLVDGPGDPSGMRTALVDLLRGRLPTCVAPREAWYLRADKIDIDPVKKIGVAMR